jgi:hypothetical protein
VSSREKQLSHAKAQSREEKVLSTEKAKHSPPNVCPDAIPESCSLCVLAPSREKQLSHAKAQSCEETVLSAEKAKHSPPNICSDAIPECRSLCAFA